MRTAIHTSCLHEGCMETTSAADVDELIWAELLEKETDPVLYDIFAKQIYIVTVEFLMRVPFMTGRKCSIPKQFSNDTSIGLDGYQRYRWRDDGSFVTCRGLKQDNIFVVQYNLYLSRKYGCQINVVQDYPR